MRAIWRWPNVVAEWRDGGLPALVERVEQLEALHESGEPRGRAGP